MLTERLWYLDHPTQAQHQHPMCGCAHCRSVHRYERQTLHCPLNQCFKAFSALVIQHFFRSPFTSNMLHRLSYKILPQFRRDCPRIEICSVLQNPCKRGQNGKFCSSWAVHLSVPWHLQQMRAYQSCLTAQNLQQSSRPSSQLCSPLLQSDTMRNSRSTLTSM